MFEEKKKFCKDCEHCIQDRVKPWMCKLFPIGGWGGKVKSYCSCEFMRDPTSQCGEEAKLFTAITKRKVIK